MRERSFYRFTEQSGEALIATGVGEAEGEFDTRGGGVKQDEIEDEEQGGEQDEPVGARGEQREEGVAAAEGKGSGEAAVKFEAEQGEAIERTAEHADEEPRREAGEGGGREKPGSVGSAGTEAATVRESGEERAPC